MYEQFRKSQIIRISFPFFVSRSPMWTCNELSVNALIMKSNVVLQTACVDRMNPNKMHTFEHEGKRGPFAGKAFLKTSKINKKIKKKTE